MRLRREEMHVHTHNKYVIHINWHVHEMELLAILKQKPWDMRQKERVEYHARGACLGPYKAF